MTTATTQKQIVRAYDRLSNAIALHRSERAESLNPTVRTAESAAAPAVGVESLEGAGAALIVAIKNRNTRCRADVVASADYLLEESANLILRARGLA